MFVRKAAIRSVPDYAVVPEATVSALEESLEAGASGLQSALDSGYQDLDRRHPALASWLAEQVAERRDELAQSLGYFLGVTVFLAFREAFPVRLQEVDQAALELALETLNTDEEIRSKDPLEVLESDDVIALGQPVLLDYVQHHMRQAVAQAGGKADLEDLDSIYRAVLIEVIALSHAISAPGSDRALS